MIESGPNNSDRGDYADIRDEAGSLIDRLFLGIFSEYLVYLALVPCWWPFAPLTLGWAGLGLLVCQHPLARRKAIILFAIASAQLAIVGFVLIRTLGPSV